MTRDNANYLNRHFAWMIPQLDVVPPVYAVIAEGQAVSICFSSRTTPLADEAGVETVDEYRGKGYAPAAVAAWACAIRELGRIPLYGTNGTTGITRVARKLGLGCLGRACHCRSDTTNSRHATVICNSLISAISPAPASLVSTSRASSMAA